MCITHTCPATILYSTILYCIVLYFTLLYCTLLYCTVLYRYSQKINNMKIIFKLNRLLDLANAVVQHCCTLAKYYVLHFLYYHIYQCSGTTQYSNTVYTVKFHNKVHTIQYCNTFYTSQ